MKNIISGTIKSVAQLKSAKKNVHLSSFSWIFCWLWKLARPLCSGKYLKQEKLILKHWSENYWHVKIPWGVRKWVFGSKRHPAFKISVMQLSTFYVLKHKESFKIYTSGVKSVSLKKRAHRAFFLHVLLKQINKFEWIWYSIQFQFIQGI